MIHNPIHQTRSRISAWETISSLLASQATKVEEDWEYVQNSIGSNVATDRLEVMRQILNLSYKNLPPHLKICFLYLGAHPEDSVVWPEAIGS